MTTPRTSSGMPDLDDFLGGLLGGDNVVWVTASHAVVAIERAFLAEGLREGEPCTYVTTEISHRSTFSSRWRGRGAT